MSNLHAETVKQLAGAWCLVSSEFSTANGNVIYPFGEDAVGMANFDASGYMSAQIMRPNRPTFAGAAPASGPLEEIQAAIQGYVAYYGRCEGEGEHQTSTTHVEGSMYPNWVGGQQVRFYELTTKQLILKPAPIVYGDEEFTGVLAWEKT